MSERLLGIVTCNIIALFLGHSLTITEGLIRKETRKDASKNDVSAIIHLKNDDLSVFSLFSPFFPIEGEKNKNNDKGTRTGCRKENIKCRSHSVIEKISLAHTFTAFDHTSV